MLYRTWQFIKPFAKKFCGSEEALSLFKERLLLVLGFLSGKPIAYRHQLPALLDWLLLAGQGVEVGVRDGAYSETLLSYSHLLKLYSVDPWREYERNTYNDTSNVAQAQQERLHAFTIRRLRKFTTRSVIMRATSREAALKFKNASLDFVYIDANHSYEACREDIALWWPKIKKGGVCAGHDYLGGFQEYRGEFGVKRAVDEFAKAHAQKVYVTPEKWPTWYVVKDGASCYKLTLYKYLWKKTTEQYGTPALWRQTRGIHSLTTHQIL